MPLGKLQSRCNSFPQHSSCAPDFPLQMNFTSTGYQSNEFCTCVPITIQLHAKLYCQIRRLGEIFSSLNCWPQNTQPASYSARKAVSSLRTFLIGNSLYIQIQQVHIFNQLNISARKANIIEAELIFDSDQRYDESTIFFKANDTRIK